MQDYEHTAIYLLAILLHESGRASVAAGDTLAHAVAPKQTRPFVEWPDLPAHVQEGRRQTAKNLLSGHLMGAPFPDFGTGATEQDLAAAIHLAEREAISAGNVLIQLNRPWVAFGDLPEAAQAGRRRQAAYLRSRIFIVADPHIT